MIEPSKAWDGLFNRANRVEAGIVTVIAFCLRLISILSLIVIIAAAGRALFWLAKPWWPQKITSDRKLLVDSFDVVEGGEVQKQRGEAFARLVSARLKQIEEVLTKDLSGTPRRPDIIVESVVPKQFDTAPAVESKLDFVEAKPFGVDVIGVLAFLRRNLQEGDRLHGIVVLQEEKTEIFAEVAGGEEIGPWSLSTKASLAEAAQALSLRVRREFLKDNHPLTSLNDDAFAIFVEALRGYQLYAQSSSGDTNAPQLLKRSAELFELLQAQNVRCAPVYSYLASIRTLQPGQNIDSAIALLTHARAIDPNDKSFSERLEDLKRRKLTLAAAAEPVRASVAQDWLTQPSLSRVRLREALQAASRKKKVRIGLLVNGVNTSLDLLKGRVVAAQSFIENELATEDHLNYGTHVATFLATIAPSADIIISKVISEAGEATTVTLLEGLNFAREQQADIVVVPLATSEHSNILAQVFEELSKAGTIVIAASGNEASEAPLYPASYPSVLGVGAVDQNDRKAAYSNFGAHVDLFAPGAAVALTSANKVERREGTTYSATLVGGIAALVLEAGAPKSDVIEILAKSTVSVADALKRIDALEALSAASTVLESRPSAP
jgi:hypothetical protein